jgi:succinyl-CoA synthetase beta subunit
MKCDVIAEGVIAAEDGGLEVPLVVRLEGTNVEEGKEIMAKRAGSTSCRPMISTMPPRRSSAAIKKA